ncbi:hypothetical protein SARC_04966 [Sphaeroforma arctica JP610]|uniref:Uncharacterized protein n=1 Tax=Sphaeroforma arctica JP610 TaxID=667725 RepID=A0A0L0G0W3_9EUKA|nr:hypothetical protein SARC_04966 [Sphaeroforma arctica JP610]KNC82752.1 hypothetical protein SARC_04966 [Sphaeroforma arctica JP610]|eukprot:XP_014156654.1 hypothetical protein SARC_04966 [Sphaeroforma arctica JP610]
MGTEHYMNPGYTVKSTETQATVDPTFRKLAKGHVRLTIFPIIEQMTCLMKNHRRAHERSQNDADFKQSLLNHCIVQLLEDSLGARTYERTLQMHTNWHLMETNALSQLLSPDIQEAQIRTTARLTNRRPHGGEWSRSEHTNSRPIPQTAQRQQQNWQHISQVPSQVTSSSIRRNGQSGAPNRSDESRFIVEEADYSHQEEHRRQQIDHPAWRWGARRLVWCQKREG